MTVLEENLALIDRAIDEARQALETDPASTYVSRHLMQTRRAKLDLLRHAAALTTRLQLDSRPAPETWQDTTMLGFTLVALLAVAQTDQTVPVQKGTRLEVQNFAGDVDIRVWDRDAVRVEVEHSDRETVDIRTSSAGRRSSAGGPGTATPGRSTT